MADLRQLSKEEAGGKVVDIKKMDIEDLKAEVYRREAAADEKEAELAALRHKLAEAEAARSDAALTANTTRIGGLRNAVERVDTPHDQQVVPAARLTTRPAEQVMMRVRHRS